MELETMRIPPGTVVMEDGKPFFFEGSNLGCLLIHGFTGTTSSMRPWGEFLASKGLTVLGPRLPGHGTDVKDMGRWAYTDWTGAVETALSELKSMCETVFVGGLSMGGLLTLYLAERKPGDIAGVMPVCSPVVRLAPGLQNAALRCVPVLKHILKTFPGPGNDLKDPSVTEVAYEKLNVCALHELVKLARVVEADLPRIALPIRIFEATEDHVVPPVNATFIYEHVGSSDKKLIWLENSYHVATLDYDKDRIFEESYDFMTGQASQGGRK